MINCIWFVVGALGLLQISPSLAMSLFGDDPVRVNFCCPDGEMLNLQRSEDQLFGSWSYKAECVKSWGAGAINTLEGMELSFLDSKNNQTEVKRKLAKLDNKMPKCGRDPQISEFNFNQTNGSTVSVDLSGKLVLRAEVLKLDTEDYCLGYYNGPYSFDGTLALSCDQCTKEVVCFYVRSYLERDESKCWNKNGQISKCDGYSFTDKIVRIADKNGDNELHLEELKSKIVEYLTIAFSILDRDDDGSIDEVLTNESIKEYSLEFFEQSLKIVVEFFDINEDESISTEDFISVVTFFEFTGLSLIILPAPLYTLYTLLDENQDEKLTLDEMLGFLRRTFTIIDKNVDCYINLEEIVAALGESDLEEDFQLGLTLIGQQYLTLAKYFVDGFIAKADTNEDTKVTLAEILKFADFSFIDRSNQIALSMGYSNYPTFEYLASGANRMNREERYKAVVVWLTTLNTFLDNPVYQSAPAQCRLAGQ